VVNDACRNPKLTIEFATVAKTRQYILQFDLCCNEIDQIVAGFFTSPGLFTGEDKNEFA